MTLRWILGLTMTIATAGVIALAILGGGFRRSFGASDDSPLYVAIAVVSAALVLASLVWPERRMVLHTVAVLMVGLAIASAFLARQTLFAATVGVLYAFGWLTFYYRTVWAAGAQASGLRP